MRLINKKFTLFLLMIILIASMIPVDDSYAAKQRFTDVPSNHWANAAIEQLANAHIINGYNDGSFKPNDYITQEEFLAIAVTILYGKPAIIPSDERLVLEGWSYWVYDVLHEKGIYTLDDYWVRDGHKRKVQITRADAARIIYILLNGNFENLPTKSAVQFLYQKHLTSGSYTDRGDYFTNYGPAERLTRAQTAAFLVRIKDYKEGKISKPSAEISLKDSLSSRIKAVAQKAGFSVTASSNPEDYQTTVEGKGIQLDFRFDEYPYADIGEHWHMTIAQLDRTKINIVASMLVELGLPMTEKEARAAVNQVLELKYGATGETYKEGKTAIYTSHYFGYHIQWGEERNTAPAKVTSGDAYALFVDGELKRAPKFNIFLEQAFAVKDTIYVPLSDIVNGMGGFYYWSDDWTTIHVAIGNGEEWEFRPDGNRGDIYIGTLLEGEQRTTIRALVKDTELFVPLDFISTYYTVSRQRDNNTVMIFVGTVPDNPTANYFGDKGQYPTTFNFDPLNPLTKYPGGWKAPQLKSSWSSKPEDNYKAFARDLGFTNNGRSYGVPGFMRAITLIDSSDKKTEVTIKLYGWGTPPGQPNEEISESFKIPVISAQLFHFYFGDQWETIWNYFNRNDIPEQFTLNGRSVDVSYFELEGSISVKIGRKAS
ncbi:S-layer homology domain-containing protein [Paenibacillus chungangensis]|uniref:S-layer homology domain-containing protein n=1 Tax=Paenibacillus chungangensis TaxID=696535 RepID=A0ABW3HR30_9BACL